MLPVTEAMSRRVVTLPLYPGMAAGDVRRIAQEVKEIVGQWN